MRSTGCMFLASFLLAGCSATPEAPAKWDSNVGLELDPGSRERAAFAEVVLLEVPAQGFEERVGSLTPGRLAQLASLPDVRVVQSPSAYLVQGEPAILFVGDRLNSSAEGGVRIGAPLGSGPLLERLDQDGLVGFALLLHPNSPPEGTDYMAEVVLSEPTEGGARVLMAREFSLTLDGPPVLIESPGTRWVGDDELHEEPCMYLVYAQLRRP